MFVQVNYLHIQNNSSVAVRCQLMAAFSHGRFFLQFIDITFWFCVFEEQLTSMDKTQRFLHLKWKIFRMKKLRSLCTRNHLLCVASLLIHVVEQKKPNDPKKLNF